MNTKLSTDQLQRPDEADYRNIAKIPVKVVLENIRSRSNIGSVFRSADAFLIEEIVLTGYTAHPPHRDIQKTALGATQTVHWSKYPTTDEALEQLRHEGYHIWAVEQTSNSVDLNSFDFSAHTPLALIFGNEVNGVEQSSIDQCDGTIEIAQFGTKHSLNISVCAGIVMFTANRTLGTSS